MTKNARLATILSQERAELLKRYAIADRCGWFVAWWRRDGGVLSRCALGATWTTTTVRGRLLRAVCVVDPGPMVDRMTTALRARAEALRPDAPMPF